MKQARMPKIISGFCVLIFLAGCAPIVETCRVIWGSSTRALEESRADALSRDFFCEFSTCFDAVNRLSRDRETPGGKQPRIFRPFIVNRAKKMIVFIGVPGAVDTTEVGVFFGQRPDGIIRVDVASLSTSARTKAAGIIFEHLAKDCLDVTQP